jgi:hypothetical protein
VHCEVGHQRRRLDEHRRVLAEERLAELPALELDHVDARPRERDADDLQRGAVGLREVEARELGARLLAGEEGAVAPRRADAQEPAEDVTRALVADAKEG